MYIGTLYHPPCSLYDLSLLMLRLENRVKEFGQSDPNTLLFLGRDFNTLDSCSVVEATGLVSLVHQSKRVIIY